MKRIIFALCLLIAVTSCVSKKKYMVAENGRLAALSRERVLNRNLGQQKDEIAKLKQQITDLMSDTTRLGQAIRDYRKSLYSNLSEQEKLNMLLKEKMEKLAEREAIASRPIRSKLFSKIFYSSCLPSYRSAIQPPISR